MLESCSDKAETRHRNYCVRGTQRAYDDAVGKSVRLQLRRLLCHSLRKLRLRYSNCRLKRRFALATLLATVTNGPEDRRSGKPPEGTFRFTKAFTNIVSPGDLNQRSFPGPLVNSITALRCFRQAFERLQLINTASITFSTNCMNRLIGQRVGTVIITFEIMLLYCS